MTTLKRLIAPALALLLACAFASALAQDGTVADPLEDLGLDGMESMEAAANRTWSVDFTALMDSENDDPFADIQGPMMIQATVIEFDGEDGAKEAYDRFFNLDDDELGLSDVETYSREDVSGIGDMAHHLLVSTGSDEFFRLSFAQKERYLLMVITIGMDEDSAAAADDILAYMTGNTDGHSGLGEFDEEGGSTGGLWEVYPANDHDLVAELVPGGDEILFPIEDDES